MIDDPVYGSVVIELVGGMAGGTLLAVPAPAPAVYRVPLRPPLVWGLSYQAGSRVDMPEAIYRRGARTAEGVYRYRLEAVYA